MRSVKNIRLEHFFYFFLYAKKYFNFQSSSIGLLTANLYKRVTVLTNTILIDQGLISSPLMPREGNPEKATEERILRAPASQRQNSQKTLCQTAVDV